MRAAMFLVVALQLVALFPGCIFFEELFEEDECENDPDSFALHPPVGGSNATFVRFSYACVVGVSAIDEYSWNVSVSGSAPGDPFPWNAGAPNVIFSDLRPLSAELATVDGGSFVYWKMDGGNVSHGLRDDDGTVPSWIVRFDHWRIYNATPGRERPGVSITWDGPDEGLGPDLLPKAVYIADASQRNGDWGVTAESDFRQEPNPGPDRSTGPGCAWYVIDRYPQGFAESGH